MPIEPVLVEPAPAEAPIEALPVVVWQLPANCEAFTDAPACMTALNARAAAAAPRAPTIPWLATVLTVGMTDVFI